MNKILPGILILVILFVTFAVFEEVNKFDPKQKRLQCQEKTITFEKIDFEHPIWETNNLIETNNFIIKSNIEYSKLMPSHLINILTVEQADETLNKVLNTYIKYDIPNDKKLLIDYYIYENDKEDKGKKGPKSKLYAGYLLFEFKLDNKLVYKIQTDYMNIDAKDIEERMDCAIKSFLSIK
ncbi:hypothetical protein [Poseidonibacter ostreae]|mgnify:CR=1 FL=1|jgi:hypothetical protein|uniref:Uncharacterized protein n=1 Tax=Poseidonibacter ostreae TaxID=2654171 RepID=A0A6L4WQ59_9BACT|nr:hypothetical protein [Poseidonibacter ostreae]KAB7885333.1 hypothetical protein GA417_08900 [Poseidonibacter ostreae]KAB7886599.1 hypothetical protein GBG19_12080 [Poseidonibacter ostreae]KAB7889434.1 hypothetical protein GBG18_11045 [Poseidonibacter ostreae]MAC84085.1 hypothetical protein [Arcobacter sp.]|tara:strand:+ start:4154 stop:4696 length:543 start_codon:yes stop_codon:yes gene_type:complete